MTAADEMTTIPDHIRARVSDFYEVNPEPREGELYYVWPVEGDESGNFRGEARWVERGWVSVWHDPACRMTSLRSGERYAHSPHRRHWIHLSPPNEQEGPTVTETVTDTPAPTIGDRVIARGFIGAPSRWGYGTLVSTIGDNYNVSIERWGDTPSRQQVAGPWEFETVEPWDGVIPEPEGETTSWTPSPGDKVIARGWLGVPSRWGYGTYARGYGPDHSVEIEAWGDPSGWDANTHLNAWTFATVEPWDGIIPGAETATEEDTEAPAEEENAQGSRVLNEERRVELVAEKERLEAQLQAFLARAGQVAEENEWCGDFERSLAKAGIHTSVRPTEDPEMDVTVRIRVQIVHTMQASSELDDFMKEHCGMEDVEPDTTGSADITLTVTIPVRGSMPRSQVDDWTPTESDVENALENESVDYSSFDFSTVEDLGRESELSE
jgi:hypothetical protein